MLDKDFILLEGAINCQPDVERQYIYIRKTSSSTDSIGRDVNLYTLINS